MTTDAHVPITNDVGVTCQKCNEWWPCDIVRESGRYDFVPPAGIPATVEQTDLGEAHKELMEMLSGIFIQQSRIYDCLMAMVPDKYRSELDQIHENGGLMASPPALREDGWDEAPEKTD